MTSAAVRRLRPPRPGEPQRGDAPPAVGEAATLGEALADPVVRLVMRADGIDPRALERELRSMARKLSGLPRAANANGD